MIWSLSCNETEPINICYICRVSIACSGFLHSPKFVQIVDFADQWQKIGYNLYIVKIATLAIGAIFFLIVISGLFYLSTPRIVEIMPANGASDVPGSTSIRVRFSRMMDVSSVTARLEITPLPAGQIAWENNTLVFTPQKPWRSGTVVQVRIGSGAKALHFPQLTLLRQKRWSFKIGSPKILYLYPLESAASLYAFNPITGAKQNLSQTIGEVLDYSVSQNGALIVITVRTENGSAIYTMSGIGGKPTLLRNFENRQVNSAVLSPSQEYLAYEMTDLTQAQAATHIWLLNIADSSAKEPIKLPVLEGQAQYPLWSSNNILAYYDRSAQAYRFYDPTIKEEIASVACQTGEQGSWAADGQSFVFAEILMPTDSAIPTSHLLRYFPTQNKIDDLSQTSNTEDASPQFSPDGHYLVFGRKFLDSLQWTPGRQIWVMDVTTLKTRVLEQEAQFNHYDFAWSPAGDQIAYMRFNQVNPTSSPEIWLIQSDGSQNQQLVSGGYNPQWIP